MEYEAISIQNSSLDAYKLMPDVTRCVGCILGVVVPCWVMCKTVLDDKLRYMNGIQVVEPAF